MKKRKNMGTFFPSPEEEEEEQEEEEEGEEDPTFKKDRAVDIHVQRTLYSCCNIGTSQPNRPPKVSFQDILQILISGENKGDLSRFSGAPFSGPKKVNSR